MRILSHMVVRNEADRYLDACLGWHQDIFDAIHVYDDCSDDATVDLARSHGCVVSRGLTPRFMEHEGQCRQAAWEAFEDALHPEPGDWTFCIDADEILVASRGEQDELWRTCFSAGLAKVTAVSIHIPEVFGFSESGIPLVRLDGWWGRIVGTRLFAYQPGGRFADKAMGSGSEPTYVPQGARSDSHELYLMHYGYADAADRESKYLRYAGMSHGHDDAHIQSILSPPDLAAWTGPWIEVRKVGR